MADTDISVPIQAPPEQTMKKKFNFWTALGIALCCSGAWEGWVASMAQGIVAGGSVGLFWGWIFVSIGITFMACALAELVSMWPSAGGQYVWAAELAPKKYKAFISWYVAWLSIAGLWLGAVSCSMGVAVQTQSYVAITRSYDMKRWHAFLINVLVIVMWVVVNIFYVRAMHWMNESILYIHVVGYFVVIITLAVCTDNKHDAKYVFTNFENNSGWEQDGVAWCVSLLPALYAFFSLDTAAHYSEEITNADVAVPRAMYLQAVINSLMTIPFVITVLFCIGDPIDVLFNSQIGFTSPFTQIVLKSTGSPAAAIILNAISTYIAFAAGLDLWGATARAMWSLARDGGLPQLFSRIHPKYDVPIPAILVTLPPSLIIIMLYIFNSTAFYGIMAGVLVAFQLSYVIPIALHLFHARRKSSLSPGRWSMGRFGVVCDIVALTFGCFMIIVMSFPTYQPVTASTMNYAVAIIGAIVIFATVLYFAYARGRYAGPATVLDAVRVVSNAALDIAVESDDTSTKLKVEPKMA
ncbi:Choline transport protein [Exophiala dermatitidis]|uniref:Amino acid transporter n=2 Tax=Exophiala dermatitidis TaxID=5970 RepID=H6BVI1_EXODN|nr:uncharacterized protein HMPREF1120_03196 [Exophiala dermatitidis NIH/UT8656]EHY55040.1 hypothetical protein HMPREF1120_03196 [Exophiala dermatitidis NIH/UT8656]KAJ4547254.1 hypothetical protein HRR78_005354 [Exophiala dermatitidis]